MTAPDQRISILVTGADLAPEALALLEGFDVKFAGARPTEDDLVRTVKELDPIGIILRYGRITARVMDAAKSLRVISKHGSGIDTIDLAHAKVKGIDVRAAVGANAVAVAEHALASILVCAKSIVPLHQSMQQGQWLKSTHKSMELRGKVLGLVGLGAIGRLVAQFGRALGMKVIAFDPYVTEVPEGIGRVTLDELWAKADVISLHCPLTDENRNLVNEHTISRMKDGVIIVNTARGGLVDDLALVRALKTGKVRAAAVDSYQVEPPPARHPFVGVPNLVMTPHIGGVSEQAYINMGVQAAKNLLDSLRCRQG